MRAALVVIVALAACRYRFEQHDDAGVDPDAAAVCGGLAPLCGPDGDRPCCVNMPVPGGTFYRGYDRATDGLFADMSHPATVSGFRLDVYEVTVGRFRRFVDAGYGTQLAPPAAGSGAHPNTPGSGWDPAWNALLPADTSALVASFSCNTYQSWTATPGANEARPINCVSWYVAQAFCIWDGGYLPTEAEWNMAAAGGEEQRAYPWSVPPETTTIDCTLADHMACGAGPSDVGTYSPGGDGRWGHADLAGNVWEWVLDHAAATYPDPCTDCADVTDSGSRVVRGGSFVSSEQNLRGADRYEYLPTAHLDNVGIRCARP